VPRDARTTDSYDETLTVPVSWWLLGLLFVLTVCWCFLVSTPLVVTIVATLVAGALVVAVLWRVGSAHIHAGTTGLAAGRATLPWESIGAVVALDPDETRVTLGVGADARAYLLVRPYCRSSVKVTLDDDVDPTPYWLLSTRRPAELADRLRAGAVRD
jgi:Protein of unknown function (DUF3093)